MKKKVDTKKKNQSPNKIETKKNTSSGKKITKKEKVDTKEKELKLPTTSELEQELHREKFKFRYKKLLKSTIYALIIVVAISVLAATLLFPVLQIYGESMEPTLVEDDIVVCIKKQEFSPGDIVAFYYNNRILVKRVIATSSQWVEIDEDGNVYVNDKLLEEDYIAEKYLGETDIEFPYQVPENSYFVLGDERKNAVDSRNSKIGTIKKSDIIGKIIFKVWPLKRFGIIN